MRQHWGSWRLALRLARADARRHRLRTGLAIALLSVTIMGAVLAATLILGRPAGPAAALRRLPDGAQAQLQAMAINRQAPPLPQPPEGFTRTPMAETETLPATASEIAGITGDVTDLHPYYTSSNLLAAKGAFDPFATDSTPSVSSVVTVDLREIPAPIWQQLSPTITTGRAPASNTEIVVPHEFAAQMDAVLGDQITIFGPPPTGWMSAEGRIDTALASQSRDYTVVGLAASDEARFWSLDGWLSRAIAADGLGINQRYLLLGDEPLTWPQVKQLNKLQVWAVSRDVLVNYPPPEQQYPVPTDWQALQLAMVTTAIGGLLGLALLLFTVTPAFTVAAEQQRRWQGLAAAGGAAPADLRRIIQAQGVLIGLVGGGIGVALGLAGSIAFLRLRFKMDPWHTLLPWWVLPAGWLIAVLAGWLAALAPARRVARAEVIAALAGRDATAERKIHLRWIGPTLLAAGFGLGAASLSIPAPELAQGGSPRAPLSSTALVAATFAAVIGGALACLNLVFDAIERVGRHLPVGFRLALGDARLHRSRAWPAAAAILVCLIAITANPIQGASSDENYRDQYFSFSAPGHLIAGAETPVSDTFDTAVLALGADQYAQLAIVARHDLRSWDGRSTQPWPLRPDGSFKLSGNGYTSVWMLGGEVYVLTPEAVRQSGLPGAEQAADVLNAGGVVVNNPDLLDEQGNVRVQIGELSPGGHALENTQGPAAVLPGAYLPRFAPLLTLSPETVADLGLTAPRKVGEYWQTERPISAAELAMVGSTTNLVSVSANHGHSKGPMSLAILGLMMVAAVGICLISLALARSQSINDMVTMVAAGATPGFVHRFGLAQSAVLLGAGLPWGALLGVGLGYYWVAWHRVIGFDGAWRLTVIPWGQLLVSWTLLAALSVAGAALIGRKLPTLTRKRLD